MGRFDHGSLVVIKQDEAVPVGSQDQIAQRLSLPLMSQHGTTTVGTCWLASRLRHELTLARGRIAASAEGQQAGTIAPTGSDP